VADKDEKTQSKPAAPSAKPGFDPKPVQLGGESLVDRLLPHIKKIAIGAAIIAAIVSAVMIVLYVKERGRRKDTGKIVKVLELGQAEVRGPGVEPDPKAKDKTFGTNKERALAMLSEMDKGGAKAPGMLRASLLLQAGQLDDSIAEYKKHTTGKTLDAVLAREGLGIAQEMKAEQEKDAAKRQQLLEEALATFQSMQPDDKGPRYAYALYHQGRILGPTLLNRPAEAKAAFDKAKAAAATDTKLQGLIEERLASLGA